MRNIIQDYIDKVGSSEFMFFNLLEFQSNDYTWYRYTDADTVQYISDTYLTGDSTSLVRFDSAQFTVENITYSTGTIVDNMSIKIDNKNQVMTALFGEDMEDDQLCRLYRVVFNNQFEVIDAVMIFEGYLDPYELDESEIRFDVVSKFVRWSDKSFARHPALCRYRRFKGPRCQYTGDETDCNRFYETCESYANTANFGGFRFLPDFMNKNIWWGPTPEERQKEG